MIIYPNYSEYLQKHFLLIVWKVLWSPSTFPSFEFILFLINKHIHLETTELDSNLTCDVTEVEWGKLSQLFSYDDFLIAYTFTTVLNIITLLYAMLPSIKQRCATEYYRRTTTKTISYNFILLVSQDSDI